MAALPREEVFPNISEVTLLGERIAAVGLLHANTIGVGENKVQFCPDQEPPSEEKQLMWLWAIQPQLGTAILAFPISAECELLLTAYRTDEMWRFWDYMSQPGEAPLPSSDC